MKTSHYLVTAAGLAAVAVAVYTQVPGLTGAREVPKPAPTVALAAEQPVTPFGQANADLPPIVTPPDGNLVIPASALGLPGSSTEEPAIALPPVPTVPAVPAVPSTTVPKLPEPPAIPPVPEPTLSKPLPTAGKYGPLTPVEAPTKPPVPEIPPPEDLVPPVNAVPAVPAVPGVPAVPAVPTATPIPTETKPAVPAMPVAPESPPATPATPALPVPPVAATPAVPAVPLTPPVSVAPLTPATPVTPPVVPALPNDKPLVPPIDLERPVGVPQVPPVAPMPAETLPKPAPVPVPVPSATNPPAGLPLLPPPSSDGPAATKPNGKYVVVKTTEKAGNKLFEGAVIVAGEKAIIRQGSFDRTVAKADLVYIAETKEEVYQHLLSKVPAKDVPARLGLARWLMFAGMREQALAESREVLKLQPTSIAASEMARSLEESIKQFPGDGSMPAAPTKPAGGALVSAEPEPDVTAEGATSYAARAQPVLANQCMECHSRADHRGAFKLIRVNGFEVGPQSTNANLRATAAQLKKEDPLNSPLLTKALAQHGGMKQPAFVSRQSAGYRVLEAWVLQAVTPVVQPMPVPAQPVLPPAAVTPPMPVPVVPAPVLPPVEPTVPVIPPAAPGAVSRPAPLIPPAPIDVPALSVPGLPAAPTLPVVPDVKVPPVLPTPPSIPPVDVAPKPATPGVPPIPVIPPAASLPKPPGGVVPASGGRGSFGTEAPPKPPAPNGPTGGDEFDPAMFNKAGTGK